MADITTSYLDIYNNEERDLFNDNTDNITMTGGGDSESTFNSGLLAIITIIAVVIGIFVLLYFNRSSTNNEKQNDKKVSTCTTGLCPLQKIFS